MLYKDFMAAGYRIFPLYGIDRNGNCECGDKECEGAGKHPRMSNWSNAVLWDDEQLASMEEIGWFASGYGVLCRGLLVIDVDARNGGVESYIRFIGKYPEANTSALEVVTGSGGGSKHVYFSLPEPIAMVQNLPEYPGLDFKTTGYVCGPGSIHKSGARYEADGYVSEITPAPLSVIEALRRPEYHRTDYNGQNVDVSHSDIADMLSSISNADLDYEVWIRIGMAVHHATQGTGYDLWEQWSATSPKHDEKKMGAKWHSFGRGSNPATLGTLVHYAEQGGWQMPVTFVPQQDFTEETQATKASGLPFSIDGIDLTQPPGFVGDVAAWIESNSRMPRRNLAVAGALSAIGNIAGLRYTDDKDGVTTNMLAFCVAGSRTGKEGIQQSIFALHKAAGIMAASHGGIKSEQEIVKNLTRHQASYYIVDEVGLYLQKINNAQKRGGAVYLEGVIAMVMSAQSKAHGYMLLQGDLKEKVREDLSRELSQITKKINDDDKTPFLREQEENLQNAIQNIDKGLDRPFLSLIGFTTPVTFDQLVNFESATNGFFGRAILFIEHDTVPPMKDDFQKSPMPLGIEMTVQQIFNDGNYDGYSHRIENYKDRAVIPSDEKALDMLTKSAKWLHSRAEDEAPKTGLESLWLGSYEIVSKISLILAVPGGIRTAEHVRWAFAIVKRDIEAKIRMVVGNEEAKPKRSSALRARLEGLCQEAKSMGVIVNRLDRTFSKEDILKTLSDMVASGDLVELRTVHPRQKTEVVKYAVPA